MTRDQLDAIRARVDDGFPPPSSLDIMLLLAEVERLNTEVEAKVAQNVALMGMNGRLQEEVERLKADPLPAAAWVREVERAAFARGSAAMREAAAQIADAHYVPGTSKQIRALPDPEDE